VREVRYAEEWNKRAWAVTRKLAGREKSSEAWQDFARAKSVSDFWRYR
jgi:hypothetical protein